MKLVLEIVFFVYLLKSFGINPTGGQVTMFWRKCSSFDRIRGIIVEVRPTLTVAQEINPFGVVVTVKVWP